MRTSVFSIPAPGFARTASRALWTPSRPTSDPGSCARSAPLPGKAPDIAEPSGGWTARASGGAPVNSFAGIGQ